jgi:hypothetical protein
MIVVQTHISQDRLWMDEMITHLILGSWSQTAAAARDAFLQFQVNNSTTSDNWSNFGQE